MSSRAARISADILDHGRTPVARPAAVLQASAIVAESAVSSVDADEARLNACRAARAGQGTVLADHPKRNRRATFAVLTLSTPKSRITDRPLPARFADTTGFGVTLAQVPADA